MKKLSIEFSASKKTHPWLPPSFSTSTRVIIYRLTKTSTTGWSEARGGNHVPGLALDDGALHSMEDPGLGICW